VLVTVRCPAAQFNPVHRPFMAFGNDPKLSFILTKFLLDTGLETQL
jgi:hypothetical protein